MTKGYSEIYLDDAMRNLGESFDYAVNACHIPADNFMNLFVTSKISEQFEKGNPKYLSGRSGTELTLDILNKAGMTLEVSEPQIEYDCSPEYWAGWILAYYQWISGKTFNDIHNYISMNDILKMYPTLHEASEDKFVDTVNQIVKQKQGTSKLQQQRKICGYSQKELAGKSGVNLRTLQQYELKSKDLSKASVETVLALSDVLGCNVEAILE